MLNLSGEILIEKMEQRFRADVLGQGSEAGAIEGSFCRRDSSRLRRGARGARGGSARGSLAGRSTGWRGCGT